MKKIALLFIGLLLFTGAGCDNSGQTTPPPENEQTEQAEQSVVSTTENNTEATESEQTTERVVENNQQNETAEVEENSNETPTELGENTACGRIVNIISDEGAMNFYSANNMICEGLYDLYKLWKKFDDRMANSMLAADPRARDYYHQGAWCTADNDTLCAGMLQKATDIVLKSNEALQAFKKNSPTVNTLINQARTMTDPTWHNIIIDFEKKWGVGPQN